MDNFIQIAAFCQPSQLKATTHAFISVIIPNTTQAQFVDCEGGKIHVFSRKMDDPDPKSPYATSTFPIMHLICPPKFFLTFVFSFLLGITAVPREIENNAYAKFGGANKVRYVENVEMANERVQHAALSHPVS